MMKKDRNVTNKTYNFRKLTLSQFLILIFAVIGCLVIIQSEFSWASLNKDTSSKNRYNTSPEPNPVIPSDLQKQLIQDLAINSNLCSEKSSISFQDIEIESTKIDINGDGIGEFIISPQFICKKSTRGASGNGDIYVYQKSDNAWKQIAVMIGNRYVINDLLFNGYAEITTYFHLSADSGGMYIYHWDENHYILFTRKEYSSTS